MSDEKDGVKVTLLVVFVATASALGTVLLANHVVDRALERVVQEAKAKETDSES